MITICVLVISLGTFFLKEFTMMNQAAGRLVPLLFSVGNHDLGMNALINRTIHIDNSGPAFLMYFPQHTYIANGSVQVPPLENRLTYHYHTFGNILHWNIDSGYLADYQLEQLDYMRTVTDDYPNYLKFAAYHNPTYYSCEHHHDVGVQDGLMYWNPFFDENKFACAFENHEHSFKKTFPLKGGRRNEKGTYYVGNGNYGAHIMASCNNNNETGIFASVRSVHHFWMVNVSVNAGTITYSAYDQDGYEFTDSFQQEISDYIF